jgi:hypothetical protein
MCVFVRVYLCARVCVCVCVCVDAVRMGIYVCLRARVCVAYLRVCVLPTLHAPKLQYPANPLPNRHVESVYLHYKSGTRVFQRC